VGGQTDGGILPRNQQNPPEDIGGMYRARRLGGLFTLDPTLRALLASLIAQPGQANAPGQLFPGGAVPEVLPPELQVPVVPGQAPPTGTLPPGTPGTGSSTQPPGAPGGGSELPIAPELAPFFPGGGRDAPGGGTGGEMPGSEKGGGLAPEYELKTRDSSSSGSA